MVLTKSMVNFLSHYNLDKELGLDYILRSVGFEKGRIVLTLSCSCEINGEFYNLDIDFESAGDQQLYTENEQLADLVSEANSCQLNSNKAKTLLDNIKSGEIEAHDSSWIEGVIKLTNAKTKQVIINNEFESNLGLDGVYESISDIENRFSDQYIIELIEFLIND